MMQLLRNATVYAPDLLGRRHILVAGSQIVWIGADSPDLDESLAVEVVDVGGRTVIPGLIDCHVHLTGGGGEAGPDTRVPPVAPGRFTAGGITSVVGLLGTDDVIHSPAELVTVVHGLRAHGLSAWCLTGGYHLPPATVTGNVRRDLVLIDAVIGVGEVALSDHRSSQPTLDELLRVAADAHVGGMMSGKAGIVHLHLGDGERGLELLREALRVAELPASVYHPTHVNRRAPLFDEALAIASEGVTVDVTAFPVDQDDDGIAAADAVVRFLESDAPSAHLTVSTDAGGCLPVFDADGRVRTMGVGDPDALLQALTQTVRLGVPLERALPPFTSNVARQFRLPGKGQIVVGGDADLVVLDEEMNCESVMAAGVWHVQGRELLKPGLFERPA